VEQNLPPGMCMRPFKPRLRQDRVRDVGYFVQDETETLQFPRPWPRRSVKTIKHHKYGSMSQVIRRPCWRVLVIFLSHFGNWNNNGLHHWLAVACIR